MAGLKEDFEIEAQQLLSHQAMVKSLQDQMAIQGGMQADLLKRSLLHELQGTSIYADAFHVNQAKDFGSLTVEELIRARKRACRLRRSSKVRLLKGPDRTVLLAAKSLGLKVEVKPIFADPDREAKYYIGNDFEFSRAYVERDGWGDEPYGWDGYMKQEGNDDASHVMWCQELKYWQPAIAALVYGNDAELDLCYQAAAILVSIPTWSERCGDVSST